MRKEPDARIKMQRYSYARIQLRKEPDARIKMHEETATGGYN